MHTCSSETTCVCIHQDISLFTLIHISMILANIYACFIYPVTKSNDIPLRQICLVAKTQSNACHRTPNISRTLICNNIVGQSDVVGASPFCAAPTTSSFSKPGFSGLGIDNCKTRRETFKCWVWSDIRDFTVLIICKICNLINIIWVFTCNPSVKIK